MHPKSERYTVKWGLETSLMLKIELHGFFTGNLGKWFGRRQLLFVYFSALLTQKSSELQGEVIHLFLQGAFFNKKFNTFIGSFPSMFFFKFWLDKEWNSLFLYLFHFRHAVLLHSIAAKSLIVNKKFTLVQCFLGN